MEGRERTFWAKEAFRAYAKSARPKVDSHRAYDSRGDCLEGKARRTARRWSGGKEHDPVAREDIQLPHNSRAGGAADQPSGGGGRTTDVISAPAGPWEAPGQECGRGERADGLTSEFELVLRLEAQDLLHFRHVP